MISILVAFDQQGTMGKNNRLPWRLPEDLAYVKKLTMGHTLVMGRKTYESMGKPLPGRNNVVLTRNRDFKADGCSVVYTIEDALKSDDDEIFIFGGAEVYKLALPYTDRMYITEIEENFYGDTFFPEVDWSNWELVSKEKGIKDDKNPYDYYFLVYDRK
jgi:dihydrofolate reductase